VGSALVLRSKQKKKIKIKIKNKNKNAVDTVMEVVPGTNGRTKHEAVVVEGGDEGEVEVVVSAAFLLGDAPSSFFGRKETLFMVLLLTTSSSPGNNNNIIKPQLALVEARHVQVIDSFFLPPIS